MSQDPIKTTLPESFEAAIQELEQLVQQMEAGALSLEASVFAYQRGSELIKFCTTQLNKIDQQVKVVESDMLKPFQDDMPDSRQ